MTSLEELLGESCAQKSVGTISRIAGSLFAGAEICLARHKEPTLLEHADFGMLPRDLVQAAFASLCSRGVLYGGAQILSKTMDSTSLSPEKVELATISRNAAGEVRMRPACSLALSMLMRLNRWILLSGNFVRSCETHSLHDESAGIFNCIQVAVKV